MKDEERAQTNFNNKLPQPQDELAQEILKDPYNFDFLTLREPYNEHMLEEALEHNIRRFLLELGTGFAYVGSLDGTPYAWWNQLLSGYGILSYKTEMLCRA